MVMDSITGRLGIQRKLNYSSSKQRALSQSTSGKEQPAWHCPPQHAHKGSAVLCWAQLPACCLSFFTCKVWFCLKSCFQSMLWMLSQDWEVHRSLTDFMQSSHGTHPSQFIMQQGRLPTPERGQEKQPGQSHSGGRGQQQLQQLDPCSHLCSAPPARALPWGQVTNRAPTANLPFPQTLQTPWEKPLCFLPTHLSPRPALLENPILPPTQHRAGVWWFLEENVLTTHLHLQLLALRVTEFGIKQHSYCKNELQHKLLHLSHHKGYIPLLFWYQMAQGLFFNKCCLLHLQQVLWVTRQISSLNIFFILYPPPLFELTSTSFLKKQKKSIILQRPSCVLHLLK